MNLEKVLKQYGLNERQARIYLACLELGSSSAQKISKKVDLARSSCYEILEQLKKQNLITAFQKKTVRYFSAEDPRHLIMQTKEKMAILEQALPQLQAVYKTSTTQPTVRFYQGQEGMKLILQEVLREAKEIYAFNSVDDLLSLLGEYWPRFVAQRVRKKIPVKVILRDSTQARERQRSGMPELREVRIIPVMYDHHGFLLIWNKKIAMFSLQHDYMALLIESEELARMQKIMFEVIWDLLGKNSN